MRREKHHSGVPAPRLMGQLNSKGIMTPEDHYCAGELATMKLAEWVLIYFRIR
jgi:hypothetical protein